MFGESERIESTVRSVLTNADPSTKATDAGRWSFDSEEDANALSSIRSRRESTSKFIMSSDLQEVKLDFARIRIDLGIVIVFSADQ
jgi:hypothetical protein